MAELSGVAPLISSKDRKDAAALTRRTFSPGSQYQHPRPRSAKTHTSYGVFDGDKLVAATTVELDPKLEHFGRGEYLAELKKMHPEVCITATVVDPEYRGQGLATKLRSHLKEQYRSILTGMSPTKSDPLMHHLNEQQGFRRVMVHPNGNVQYFWAKNYEQTKHADWRKSVGDAAHHVGEVLTTPIPGTPEWFVRPGKRLASAAGRIPNVMTGKIGNGVWDVSELARKMKIACLVKAAELAEDGEHRLQGHIDFQGLGIAVENRKGSVRSGSTPDGKKWRTEMKAPYGYIEAPAKGKDGESLDAYVGPDRDAPIAYVVHQHKPDGTGHDEDKVMLGCADEEAAKKLYLQHYDDPKFLGPVDAIQMDRLKALLQQHRKIEKFAGAGPCAPIIPPSQRIKWKAPRAAAPAVRSLPGMPKVLK